MGRDTARSRARSGAFYDRDLSSQPGGYRSHFHSHEARTDDDQLAALGKSRAQTLGVFGGPERDDAFELFARHAESPVARSSRQDQPIVLDGLGAADDDLPPEPVDRGGAGVRGGHRYVFRRRTPPT